MPTSLRPQEPLLPCPKNSGAVLRSGCRGEQELEHSSAWLQAPGLVGTGMVLPCTGLCCPHLFGKPAASQGKAPAPAPAPAPVASPGGWGTGGTCLRGLSWEVPGEEALEPAPSFPWLQVPGGFGGALCSPVPSPRTGNSSGNGQDVSSSRVSGRPCLWLRLSLLSFAFEAA